MYLIVRVDDGNASELADEWNRVTQALKECGYDLGKNTDCGKTSIDKTSRGITPAIKTKKRTYVEKK